SLLPGADKLLRAVRVLRPGDRRMEGLPQAQTLEDAVDLLLGDAQILGGDPVRVQPRAHRRAEPLQYLVGAIVLRVEVDAALGSTYREPECGGLGGHATGEVLHLAEGAAGAHPQPA